MAFPDSRKLSEMYDVITARNRHNALSRHHGCDDPRTREAAANLRAAKIAELIQSAPPLTPEQVDRLRGLLPASADTLAQCGQVGVAIDQRETREAVTSCE